MTGELFQPAAHERVIEQRATAIAREMAEIVAAARRQTDEGFSRISAFHRRSVAQQKRFMRIKQIESGFFATQFQGVPA